MDFSGEQVSGADGVLVPHVASPDIAREIVALARYSGARGLSPTTRAGTFGAPGTAEHMTRQDERCAVIAMIEDADSLDRIDRILATDGLDAIFIGRADLAASMGPAAANGGTDRAVDLVLASARDVGMPAVVLTSNRTKADEFRSRGATGFLSMSDQGFLREQAARIRDIFSL
ncbi:HpcH/HpaI aldolase (plasmid) [Cereibacter sphaeroides WS8N]|uniref:aldolase/citrate lyase family protein n=1 Tax=Cereibacter sphaeroides TaxID=1063 RepID=UPI00020B027E|nr:aldolase/citrate lyase family protein [Cereibacter sphaeroides]EGJ19277.1 HpcH/HpaI aldolase [Cereibacter sphaeroides WS8N]